MSAPGRTRRARRYANLNGGEIAAKQDRPDSEASVGIVRFGGLELTQAEAAKLSNASIADRLVESGVSRLTAARIVEVARGGETGRARPHKNSR